VARYILHSPGLAASRRCRLSSNVRPRSKHKLMASLALPPTPLNTSLRLRNWSRRAPETSTASSGKGSWSQAQAARFGRPQQPSRQSEGASRRQPIRHPRSGQFCGSVQLSPALRAKPGESQFLAHLAQVQGTGFVVFQSLGLGQLISSARSCNAWPNPSLKPRPNGKTLAPRYSAVHHLQRGASVSPPVPA